MKQEDKELILKDLCARLPYGVKVRYMDLFNTPRNRTLDVCLLDRIINLAKDVKPYLFPMLSMTEEQEREYYDTAYSNHIPTIDSFDWLNQHHFDYRGLIDKGLAIDATNLNIY